MARIAGVDIPNDKRVVISLTYVYGIGLATSKAVESIARQPEAKGDINKALLLGCALAEATAVYGLVIGLVIILFLR